MEDTPQQINHDAEQTNKEFSENAVKETTTTTIKKGRGRPSSKKNIASTLVQGNVTTPKDKDNIVEMISNQCQIFKRLPDILKAFNVHRIWIKLMQNGIHIFFMDHTRTSFNKIHIPSNSMMAYYFANDAPIAWLNNPEPLTMPNALYLGTNRDNLMEVFKNMGDNFSELRFIVRRNEKKWFISVTTDIGSTEINQIPRINALPYSPPPDTPEFDAESFDYSASESYDVSFEMQTDELKKIIMRAGESPIQIIKSKKNELSIKCEPKDGVPFMIIYQSEKYKMKTKLKEDDLFVVAVNPNNIKIAANSSIMLMNFVKISVSENKKMSLRWYSVDILERETCILHSYVDTIKN